MILAMLVVYVFVFWLMNAIYHLPLLIAGELGVVKRDDGGPSRLSAVYKNGFLLTASSPAYTFGVTLTLLGVLLILTISGFGLALLGCSFATYLTTSATRDQLVRLGMLEPLPDIDTKVVEERWRLKKD